MFARLDDGWDIYSILADGTRLTRLTDDAADDLYPAWYANHTRIAFQSGRDTAGIYSMKPDGSNAELLYRNVQCGCLNDTYRFAISPGGDRVAFTPSESNDVRVAAPGDTAARRVAVGNQVAWSPDGALLGFTVVAGLGVGNPDGPGQRTLLSVTGAREIAWSPDQKRIVYTQDIPLEGWVLWLANADGTNQVQLTEAEAGSPVFDLGATWSRDGAFVAFQREHRSTACGAATCYDLMVIRVDGTGLTNVTGSLARRGVNVRPSW